MPEVSFLFSFVSSLEPMWKMHFSVMLLGTNPCIGTLEHYCFTCRSGVRGFFDGSLNLALMFPLRQVPMRSLVAPWLIRASDPTASLIRAAASSPTLEGTTGPHPNAYVPKKKQHPSVGMWIHEGKSHSSLCLLKPYASS